MSLQTKKKKEGSTINQTQVQARIEFSANEAGYMSPVDEKEYEKTIRDVARGVSGSGVLTIEYDYRASPQVVGLGEKNEVVIKFDRNEVLNDGLAHVSFHDDTCIGCSNTPWGHSRHAVVKIAVNEGLDEGKAIELIKGVINTLTDFEKDAIDIAYALSNLFADYLYRYTTKGMRLDLYDSGGDNPESKFEMTYYG